MWAIIATFDVHSIDQFWNDPAWYNFVSGPLVDITLVTAVIVWARKHTCHVHGCWRIGRHAVNGTEYVVCRKHHPNDHVSAQQVLDEHTAAKERCEKDEAVAIPNPPPSNGK